MITETFHKELSKCISVARHSVLIVSPYVTVLGAEVILKALGDRKSKKPLKLEFVTRPQGPEYITGFVEPRALLMLKEAGFEIRVLESLHAKIYLVDDETVFVGSANATAFGLGTVPDCNKEIMIQAKLSPRDSIRIRDEYFDVAVSPKPAINEEYVGLVESKAADYRTKQRALLKDYELPDPGEGSDWPDDVYGRTVNAVQEHQMISYVLRKGMNEFLLDESLVKVFYSAPDRVSDKYSFDIVRTTGEGIRNGKYAGILLSLGEAAVLGIPTPVLRKILLRKNQMKNDDWQFKVCKLEDRWMVQIGKGKSKQLINVNDYLWHVPSNDDALQAAASKR